MSTVAETTAKSSLWAKLRRRRTKGEMIAMVPVFMGVLLIDGAWGWLFAGAVSVALVVWMLTRPMPPSAAPRRTSAENRAANEARWAQGVERDRRERAEREAEYERAAEQRRREAAARRMAEAAAGGSGS